MRGAIFESWVVSEIYKAFVHSGVQPNLFHYREARGPEIDLLVEQGEELAAVEIKSGATTTADYFKNLKRFSERMTGAGKTHRVRNYVVYGGDDSQRRSDAQVLSWRHVQKVVAD
jgi:predicted AAA+ superfamily ATPase